MNAIKTNRIHQAYLFTGSRGIGKTSIARIFAKAIRCEQAKVEADTSSFLRRLLLLQRDHLRQQRRRDRNRRRIEQRRRGRSRNPRKCQVHAVYGLPQDLHHRRSSHAHDRGVQCALLKTLEEPPAHVIFMFATTEPHKIPATILSRCQRFDLRRVTVTQIQQRLTEISQIRRLESRKRRSGASRPRGRGLDARCAFASGPGHRVLGTKHQRPSRSRQHRPDRRRNASRSSQSRLRTQTSRCSRFGGTSLSTRP